MIENLSFYSQAITFVVVIVCMWYAWDMRSILKAMQVKDQLSIAGDWQGLEKYFKRAAQNRRPFVWLHRKFLMPGNLDGQYAMFLFKQGRQEEALEKINEALRLMERKPVIFQPIHRAEHSKTYRTALDGRVLILSALSRYDEAREVGARLAALGEVCPPLALLEFNCGNIDKALALAEAFPAGHSQHNSMRAVSSLVHFMKGNFDQALEVLAHEPSSVSTFYSPAGMSLLNESPDGAKLLDIQRKKLAGFFPPARLVQRAGIRNHTGNFETAAELLDEAEKTLGSEPALQMAYCQQRACCLAGQGKSEEAEIYIERMRKLTKQLPKRSLLLEFHTGAGRAYLYLKRFEESMRELVAAQPYALHAIQKHVIIYWIAKAHEEAGHSDDAYRNYQMIYDDGIPGWMHQEAVDCIAARKV